MKDNYKSRIMKNLFNYWFKTNKKSLYDQLGKEFNVSGFRVYKLAHGKTAHSHMDRLILEKLLELKIISEIKVQNLKVPSFHTFFFIIYTDTILRVYSV